MVRYGCAAILAATSQCFLGVSQVAIESGRGARSRTYSRQGDSSRAPTTTTACEYHANIGRTWRLMMEPPLAREKKVVSKECFLLLRILE